MKYKVKEEVIKEDVVSKFFANIIDGIKKKKIDKIIADLKKKDPELAKNVAAINSYWKKIEQDFDK